MELLDPYLHPTEIIDSNHPEIIAFAEEKRGAVKDPVEIAVRLYYAVRDGIWYDPYFPFYLPAHYRASRILRGGRGFCIPKASLLCALGRASGIPCRPSFADVRNHLATRQLLEFMGSDIFVYHAFVEFFLEGKWVKSTPAFNKELCLRHKVIPLEFNGREDSIFQPYNSENRKFMEYLVFHGSFADIPVTSIVDSFKRTYGPERVRSWIEGFERDDTARAGHFDVEDVVQQ
jgi:transglutaminase-like putative cysteine protease